MAVAFAQPCCLFKSGRTESSVCARSIAIAIFKPLYKSAQVWIPHHYNSSRNSYCKISVVNFTMIHGDIWHYSYIFNIFITSKAHFCYDLWLTSFAAACGRCKLHFKYHSVLSVLKTPLTFPPVTTGIAKSTRAETVRIITSDQQ